MKKHLETPMEYTGQKRRVTNGRGYLYCNFECPTCRAKKSWTRVMFAGGIKDFRAVCTGVKQERD